MEYMSYFYAQKYLLFLIGVMISAGIIKEMGYLDSLFAIITKYVKSKRLTVFLVSFFGGILPIPGRVTVSAGILDSLAPTCDPGNIRCRKSRAKFGIIDYLSTHHYYLWSPLEKTVILPMAALGIGWVAFMSYMWPLVVISFIYIFGYIFLKFKEEDIIIQKKYQFNSRIFLLGTLPLFLGIGLLALGYKGQYVFPILAAWYIYYSKIFSIKKINSFINWWLVLILFIVLILSVFFKSHITEIETFIKMHQNVFDLNTFMGFISISAILFVAAWLMGSSGKYAGLVAILLSIYGIHYLVWFLTLEFTAYNLSPTHKCTHIGRMYFKTPMRKYYEAIFVWQFLLLLYAGIYTLAL